MSETSTDTHEQKTSGVSKLKENSLKAAGVAYLIGDAAIVATGLFDKGKTWKGRAQHAAVGAYWGLGGLAAARYGNPKAEKQIDLISQRLGEYLKKQGVEIPQTPTTENLTKSGGVIDHVEKFLYAHPSEVLNTIYALGAGQLLVSNRSNLRHAPLTQKMDFATGALVAAGALSGLLIPERKRDPEHPPQGALGKTMAWIQEKPLRLSAGFYWGGNAVMLYGASEAMKEARKSGSGNKSYLWRFLVAGSYIFANTMLSLSSKGHGGGAGKDSDKVTARLAEESAQVIAAQPKEVQEALVQHISGYLASQPEIKLKATEISDLLHTKLTAVTKNHKQPETNWQTRVQAQSEPAHSPAL